MMVNRRLPVVLKENAGQMATRDGKLIRVHRGMDHATAKKLRADNKRRERGRWVGGKAPA